jgi:hypothetical protein
MVYLQTTYELCFGEAYFVYVIWMWIDWYRKYQHAEPEYEVCCRVSETKESQTSYSIVWGTFKNKPTQIIYVIKL